MSKYRLADENRPFEFIDNIRRLSLSANNVGCVDPYDHRFWINQAYRTNAVLNDGQIEYTVEFPYDNPSECFDVIYDLYLDMNASCIGEREQSDYLKAYYYALDKYLELEYWTVNDAIFLSLGLIPASIYVDNVAKSPVWNFEAESYGQIMPPGEVVEFCTSIIGMLINTVEVSELSRRYVDYDKSLLPVKDVVNFLLIKKFFFQTDQDFQSIGHTWKAELRQAIFRKGLALYGQDNSVIPKWNGTISEAEFLAQELKRKSFLGSQCHKEFGKIFLVKGNVGKGNPISHKREKVFIKIVLNLPK